MTKTDIETLVVQMSADFKQFQREFQKGRGVANTEARAIENRFIQMNKRLDGIGKDAARSLIAPLATVGAALSIKEVLRYADAWTSAKNSLAVAGVTGSKQVDVLNLLYASAQKNATPIGALADLYGKAAQASDNLGASQNELLQFSDGVATALRVAGTGAGEASGALTQLGQLLGSARVQAEEFNSVNEGARPILIAVANGLDAAGGSVNKLKQLVNDGTVSGKQFFQAFLKGLPSIQAMAANATQTIAQGYTKVDNALTKYIGSTDSSLGASQRLVQGLNALADNFDTIADTTVKVASVIAAAFVGRAIGGMILKLGLGVNAIGKFVTAIRAARTAASVGSALSGIGAAAGPIGAALGLAAGAALYFASSSDAAADSTETAAQKADRYAEALKRVNEAAKGAGSQVKQAGEDFATIESARLNSRLVGDQGEYDKSAGQVRSAVGDVLASLDAVKGEFGDDPDFKKEVDGLKAVNRNLDGTVEGTRKAIAALVDLGKTDAAIQRIVDKFDLTKELLTGMAAEVRETKREIDSLKPTLPNQDADKASAVAFAKEREETNKALAKRIEDSKQSDTERAIDQRAEQIVKELGDKITLAAAKIQARTEIGNEKATQAYEGTISGFTDRVVSAESSGNESIKNPNSTATGLGQFIESTWLRLFKKYFPTEAATMTDPAILALRTNGQKSRAMIDAYARENAGILQKAGVSVDEVALQLAHFLGPQGAVNVLKAKPGTLAADVLSPDAVKANPKILGNGRTVDDVIAYGQKRAGISSAGTKRLDEGEDFDRNLIQQKTAIEQLKEETGLRAALNPLINDYGKALSTQQKAQELFNLAQEHGTAAGRELTSTQQLLTGDLSKLTPAAQEQALAMRALATGYGEADASANQLVESQERLRSKVEEWRDFSKDATKGFIQDLVAGKSAAEALGGVLEKIGGKLLDLALDDLFGSSGSSGWFSSIFKKDGGPIKLAGGGGVRGPGGPRADKVPAMLSNGEFVVNAAATQKNRGLLEAINSGKSLMLANGGIVRAPSMPNLSSTFAAQRSVGPSITYAPTVDARGADVAAVTRLEAALQQDRRDFTSKVIGTIRTAKQTRQKGI